MTVMYRSAKNADQPTSGSETSKLKWVSGIRLHVSQTGASVLSCCSIGSPFIEMPPSSLSVRWHIRQDKRKEGMVPQTPKRAGREPHPESKFPSQVLAANVVSLRALRGIRQEELAERMRLLRHGWSRATVSELSEATAT
jgi:hypothetical protein